MLKNLKHHEETPEHLTLQELPRAIADLQQEIADIDLSVSDQKQQVGFCLSAIDRQVASDSSLKNDTQRKARKAELMETDGDYQQAARELRRLEILKAELDIDLDLLLNLFAIRKLAERRAIAELELKARLAA